MSNFQPFCGRYLNSELPLSCTETETVTGTFMTPKIASSAKVPERGHVDTKKWL